MTTHTNTCFLPGTLSQVGLSSATMITNPTTLYTTTMSTKAISFTSAISTVAALTNLLGPQPSSTNVIKHAASTSGRLGRVLGGAIGGSFAVVFLLVLCIFFIRRHRKRNKVVLENPPAIRTIPRVHIAPASRH
jgi:Ca2+/H+ antiporter